ncbi:hypothetical protein [Mycobacterium sp.]|uniref:hypothetical protein n=1 Tax=Mycobacterium sp. TaxID=1785 RepID=UPI00126DC2A8|nr:hypothetical protein [Mycobacterium sp.]KAA8960503.1 MAG: hypothetical protein F6Q13_13455 [Mycobacterium sp.]
MQPSGPGVPPHPGQPPHDPWAQSAPAYGWQAPAGYWPPTGPGYGQQPGYGSSPGGPAGYPQPAGPSGQHIALWITLGVVILLGLIGAILTLTLLIDISSAVTRVSSLCDQYGGQLAALCKQSLRNRGVTVPAIAVVYLPLIILGHLAALGGALLMLAGKLFGQFLILGGGVMILFFATICAAQYGSTGRIVYDLTAGLVIAVAGGLLLPQIRPLVGRPPPGSGGQLHQFGGVRHASSAPYPGPSGRRGPGGSPPPQW